MTDSPDNGAGPAGSPALPQRLRMVQTQLQQRGIRDQRVLAAMMRLPRERFMPPEQRHLAYEDEAVAIGCGQTISQPYMVAIMTEELALVGGERVLEIGTGSGYQTALLAELVRQPTSRGSAAPDGQVYTVERLAGLSVQAREVLWSLGYRNISFKVGDGSLGWPEFAPYDAILLTAAAPSAPEPLIDQLAVNGRFVGPIGPDSVQTLVKWTRTQPGEILKQNLLDCRFVRLIGSAGWPG